MFSLRHFSFIPLLCIILSHHANGKNFMEGMKNAKKSGKNIGMMSAGVESMKTPKIYSIS